MSLAWIWPFVHWPRTLCSEHGSRDVKPTRHWAFCCKLAVNHYQSKKMINRWYGVDYVLRPDHRLFSNWQKKLDCLSVILIYLPAQFSKTTEKYYHHVCWVEKSLCFFKIKLSAQPTLICCLLSLLLDTLRPPFFRLNSLSEPCICFWTWAKRKIYQDPSLEFLKNGTKYSIYTQWNDV